MCMSRISHQKSKANRKKIGVPYMAYDFLINTKWKNKICQAKCMTIFAGLFAREGVLLLADPNGVSFLENAK